MLQLATYFIPLRLILIQSLYSLILLSFVDFGPSGKDSSKRERKSWIQSLCCCRVQGPQCCYHACNKQGDYSCRDCSAVASDKRGPSERGDRIAQGRRPS